MDHQNGMDKFDALDADGREVAALLSALPRVEAPENFDLRVKARIAEGRPVDRGFFPYLKVVAPLALVLVVVGLVVFYGMLPGATENPAVASSTMSTPPQIESEKPTGTQTTNAGSQISEVPVVPERASSETTLPGPVRQTRPPVTKDRSSGSGSHDFDGGGSLERSLTPANTILPPGFQSANPSRENRNANDGQADIPIQDVLQILGINAEFSGDGWRVGSAVANGAGYRAGVREGDVVEAIDGQTLTRDTKFKNGFNGKTLRVRRDGKSISLRLGN